MPALLARAAQASGLLYNDCMRLAWLDPRTVQAARDALGQTDPPAGVDPDRWRGIENFVRRAEAVSAVVRAEGVDVAIERFGGSSRAVEVAVVIMASSAIDRATVAQIQSLLECDIDEDILYGTFLRLLVQLERSRTETLAIYEQFHERVSAHHSDHPQWKERLAVVREGLAELYIASGRYDAGHDLFAARNAEDTEDLAVALSASRAFLAAGKPGRAAEWLGRAADRAREHGRREMERKLREKQRVLEDRAAD